MNPSSRRGFLRHAGSAAGAALIGVSLPRFLAASREAVQARRAGEAFRTLAPDEAVEIEAIAACILPTTDTPGAREAGAIYFIDNVLGTDRPDLLAPIRSGLADLQERVRAAAGPASRFSGLDEEARIAILTAIEHSDFFAKVRLLTLAGVFADPAHGGNRGRVGWELIGFDGHFGTQPPFGWYDAHAGSDEP